METTTWNQPGSTMTKREVLVMHNVASMKSNIANNGWDDEDIIEQACELADKTIEIMELQEHVPEEHEFQKRCSIIFKTTDKVTKEMVLTQSDHGIWPGQYDNESGFWIICKFGEINPIVLNKLDVYAWSYLPDSIK